MTLRVEYSERVPFDPLGTTFHITESFIIEGWGIFDEDDNLLYEGFCNRNYPVVAGNTFVLTGSPEGLPGMVTGFLNQAAYVKIKKAYWDVGDRPAVPRKKRITKQRVDWARNGF